MCQIRYKPTRTEQERRRRIMLAVWAYAYEIAGETMVSDAEFDRECSFVNLNIDTDHVVLDQWFKDNFDPSTGMWIHQHPELDKVKAMYTRIMLMKKEDNEGINIHEGDRQHADTLPSTDSSNNASEVTDNNT